MLDKALLAKIHIAKKALGMDDETYRAMLASIGGVSSSKDLTEAQAKAVLAHCQRCGWVPKVAQKHGRKPKVAKSRAVQLGKLEALMAERGYPWEYLTKAGKSGQSMVQRICKVDAIEFCDAVMLGKLIAALSYDVQRRGKAAK